MFEIFLQSEIRLNSCFVNEITKSKIINTNQDCFFGGEWITLFFNNQRAALSHARYVHMGWLNYIMAYLRLRWLYRHILRVILYLSWKKLGYHCHRVVCDIWYLQMIVYGNDKFVLPCWCHLIISIMQSCLKELNRTKTCQVYAVKCVYDQVFLHHHHYLVWSVHQLAHSSADDHENICTCISS